MGIGLVDEITDRTWVVVDAVDGRVHYAELGRLTAAEVPARGMLVTLGGDDLQGKPSRYPRLQVLSPVEIERHAAYDGPTWLDQAILSKWRPDASGRGFATEVDSALTARGRWLAARDLAEATPAGDIAPNPHMMHHLRQVETERLAGDLSRRLNASYLPAEPGRQIAARSGQPGSPGRWIGAARCLGVGEEKKSLRRTERALPGKRVPSRSRSARETCHE